MGRHNISIWAAMSNCVNSEALEVSDSGTEAGRSGQATASIGHRLFLQLLFLRYAEIAGHEQDEQLLEASKRPDARDRVGVLCDEISSKYAFSPFDSRGHLEHELAVTQRSELCNCIKRIYSLNLNNRAKPDHISLAHLAWAFGLAMKALDEGRSPPVRGKPYPADEIAHLASSLVELRLSGKQAVNAANLTAFDPFCGSGYLLLAMFDEFLSRPGPGGTAPNPVGIAGGRLFGMDGRAWAADASRTFLAIRCLMAVLPGAGSRAIPSLRANIRDNWSLGDWMLAGMHREAWPLPDSFDITLCDIAAFPERRGLWLDLERGQGGLTSSYVETSGRNAYRSSLLESLTSFLAPEGMAGAIFPMNVTTGERRLMQYLCERGAIRRLEDFRRDIFRRAAVQATSFVYMGKARQGPLEAFRYPLPPPGVHVGYVAPWAAGYVFPGSRRTSDHGFLSLTADEAGIMDKLERAAWLCLGDFCDLMMGRGTGRDDVFIVEPTGGPALPSGLVRVHSRADNTDIDLEPEVLLPVAERDGITPYASQTPRRLIIPFSARPDGTTGIVPAALFGMLPQAATYLAGSRSPLPAQSGTARPSFRFRPHRTPPCVGPGRTFIIGRDSAEGGFSLLSGPVAIGASLIAVLPRDGTADIHYLLGILNSSLFRWYVCVLRPTPSAPSRPSLRRLALFPLVAPDPADPSVGAIRLLTQKRLAMAGLGMTASSSAALSVERQIDEAVFDRYGLTQQDRDMVMRDLAIADAHRNGKAARSYSAQGAKAAPPHIVFDYDKPYEGILPAPYDPFDSSTNLPVPGSPHYVGPSDGPAFRFCRWAGLDSLTHGTTKFGLASIPARAAPLAAAPQYVFTARCKLDVKAGQRFLIPSADPNSLLVSVETPDLKGTHYATDLDPAGNWYLTLDRDYKGILEYAMGLDTPLSENAFVTDFSCFTGKLPTLPRICPGDELRYSHIPSVGDFIRDLQAYFSSYDPQNGRPGLIAALEAETTAQARMDFMIAKRVGSCRHRAWLGYLLCTEAGLPTRYDISAVHAWLECRIEGKWRYIDLGGTPMDFDPPADGCSTEPSIVPRIEPPWRPCDPGCVEYPYCPSKEWGRPCKQYYPGRGH